MKGICLHEHTRDDKMQVGVIKHRGDDLLGWHLLQGKTSNEKIKVDVRWERCDEILR